MSRQASGSTRPRPSAGAAAHLKVRHSIATLRKSAVSGVHVSGVHVISRRCEVGTGTHLLSLLWAVMLATMMLSGLGEATALKVPFQNFSKSSFSSSCDPRDREGWPGGGGSGHGGCISRPKTGGGLLEPERS